MSRIDELIAELCPEGVEFRRIEDAVDVVPTSRGIEREDYANGTLIPIIDQGQSFIVGHTDDKSAALADGEYIVLA